MSKGKGRRREASKRKGPEAPQEWETGEHLSREEGHQIFWGFPRVPLDDCGGASCRRD